MHSECMELRNCAKVHQILNGVIVCVWKMPKLLSHCTFWHPCCDALANREVWGIFQHVSRWLTCQRANTWKNIQCVCVCAVFWPDTEAQRCIPRERFIVLQAMQILQYPENTACVWPSLIRMQNTYVMTSSTIWCGPVRTCKVPVQWNSKFAKCHLTNEQFFIISGVFTGYVSCMTDSFPKYIFPAWQITG